MTRISDGYQPNSDDIESLLTSFQEKKERFKKGLKNELGDLPLSEAIWISEADLNYLRGDARTPNDTILIDSIEIDIPYFIDNGGEVRIEEVDLLTAHQAVLALIPDSAQTGGIRCIDVSIFEIDPDHAKLRFVTYRRAVAGIFLPPPPVGCFWLNHPGDPDAHEVMNYYLAYHEQLSIGTQYPRPYYVSISSQEFQSTTTAMGILNGYTLYIGSPAALGGPEWLASGPYGEEVCFPDYWQKHLILKQHILDQYFYQSGRVFINEVYDSDYDPRSSLNPMDYGSPYYPMGPWDHTYRYRRAILSRFH